LVLLPRCFHRLRGAGEKREETELSSNNNFPLLYPLSSSSDVDKRLTGKCRWKEDGDVFSREVGCGVPINIKGGGDLFSVRVGPTLVMKRLWDGRKAFLKSKRSQRRRRSREGTGGGRRRSCCSR